jgi:hypothetical protein
VRTPHFVFCFFFLNHLVDMPPINRRAGSIWCGRPISVQHPIPPVEIWVLYIIYFNFSLKKHMTKLHVVIADVVLMSGATRFKPSQAAAKSFQVIAGGVIALGFLICDSNMATSPKATLLIYKAALSVCRENAGVARAAHARAPHCPSGAPHNCSWRCQAAQQSFRRSTHIDYTHTSATRHTHHTLPHRPLTFYALHAHPLLSTEIIFVPYGLVLVRVRVPS